MNDSEPRGPRIPSEAIAAGLILSALALGFALAPRIVGAAGGIESGLGFFVAVLLAVLLGGGFIGVFWLRGRARRKAD